MVKIEIQSLEFSYNGFPVLKNINENIDKGEFVGVVGPNGSGKSTLLRCLDRILKPKHGKIFLNSKNIRKLSRNDLARQIAYVPQKESNTFPATVFDTVLMGRKPHINWMPVKKDLDITSKVIEMLDLTDIAFKDINQLSGGQRQRVFIARALAQQPEVLLLDEPTANLDLRHQMEVMNILKSLTNKDITIIIAIHDLNMALQYCNKLIMLKDGEIFAKGGKDIITTDTIEKLYDIKVNIIKENGRIFIIPKLEECEKKHSNF